MNLKSYLELSVLLQKDQYSREENRAFGLTKVELKDKPLEQLLLWREEHQKSLVTPTQGDTFDRYLYGITLSLVIIGFIIGLLSGIGLLSYSGHEPVNVIYFIVMIIFVPLFTMSLGLLSMLRANSAQSMLVHISPAFWMEKLLSFLPKKMQTTIKEFKLNPLLLNWIIIRRAQMIALFFSLGLFVALLMMVVTKDIAFAWSTTLNVTPEAFHSFLHTLAVPWRDFVPSAVPTIELIERSHFFRLGDSLSEDMISHANILGEWWKFLAMATLFYAIFLRFLIYLLASIGLKRALKKSFFTLRGANKLLTEMNEPIISTRAQKEEEVFVPTSTSYAQILAKLDSAYDAIHGWAIPKENLVVLGDSIEVRASVFVEVGGTNTLDEDSAILTDSQGKILFFVKGWEPPTMDFVDYLDDLSNHVDKVVVFPIGTAEDDYDIAASSVDVWDRKLTQLNKANVWLKR